MKHYDVYVARLEPVQGSEMGKTRPVVIVSDDLRNQLLQTVVACPLTSQLHGCEFVSGLEPPPDQLQ